MLLVVSQPSHVPTSRYHSPHSNRQTPHRLRLEAVALGHAGPVAQAQLIPHLVQVVLDRGREGVGVCCIYLGARLADNIAVQIAYGLADRHGDYDESDEQERVCACHDKQTKIGFGPVVGHADENVESRDAGLAKSQWAEYRGASVGHLTMMIVPTNSLGGSTPRLTMLPMKLEVMPMITTMEMTCMMRTSKKVLLKGMAP